MANNKAEFVKRGTGFYIKVSGPYLKEQGIKLNTKFEIDVTGLIKKNIHMKEVK